MSHSLAKKIRKATKYNYIHYVEAVSHWPYTARLRFAWYLASPFKELKSVGRRTIEWLKLRKKRRT